MSIGFGERDNPSNKLRLLTIGGIFVVSILIFVLYLFSLQVVRANEFQRRAQQVARRSSIISAQRGEIYDRNFDLPLAINIPSFAVNVIPAELSREDRKLIFPRLAEVLDLTVEQIEGRILPSYDHLYQPVEVASGVDLRTISYLAEHIDDFPGITWNNKSIRSYTVPGSLSHIIGYVGDITREELQVLYNQGYSQSSTLGKSGIEKVYDKLLRGTDGIRYSTVDVRGRRVFQPGVDVQAPVSGNNLVLTIDRRIQKLVEEALGPRVGSVVVLKPSTGEILAMVSYPWFNPNMFGTERDPSEYRKTSLDPRFPFLNRAIQASYAPASAFKTVMTTAILEEKVFPPEQKIDCPGYLRIGNRVFNCHKKTGHGPLDLKGGLAESCNVYFWTVGLRYLGVDRIINFSQQFGFGQTTNVDLPGETAGRVPSPQWKEETFNVKWVGGDTANISIGQGDLLVTPVQMANMMAMVVNEGIIYRPHFLKEIRDPVSGSVVEEQEPEILQQSTINPEVFKKVQEYLRGVIVDGTAKVVLTTQAVEVAGKTGTGEAGFEDQWSSWFVAYAPFNGPSEDQVVVAINVEAVNDWEWWAPKAANIIFQGIFADEDFKQAVKSLRWQWMFPDLFRDKP
ncbi:penicillin-binding protein 2 [Marispirochaeta aestuarii]|uniref:penicillin-binding protein 2 n=1 Tax=Marispirochaeta aestuarii TaxID=1963862 RepID=UPI0029C8CD35|nr:penicillin-binding protein 2 [Marispirochaeta aestuarii]